ncbi:Chaperone protein dnaJ 72 [Picochlorum sp. SENEW3]|nr:Chaperone protein dnaJ 72 [Picochlorum sp. SENEW3]
MGVRDPFRVLGIDPSASKEDIKKAYRRKVLECHPDRHHGSPDSVRQNAEKQFTAVSEAYEQLINQRTRSASGQSTSSSSSSAYRYSYTRHGYQHTQYYRDRGKTRSSSIGSKFISFVYMLKSTGSLAATALVGGVFIGGLLAFDPLISTLWVERNKGKSFEDMIAEVERAKAINKRMQHIIANHMDHRSMVLKRLMHQCMATLDSSET